MQKVTIIIGIALAIVAAIMIAYAQLDNTRDTNISGEPERQEDKNRVPLQAVPNALEDLLTKTGADYRTARTTLLADPNVQNEIDAFVPTNSRGHILKASIQGWVAHEAQYASVLASMLAAEEGGRSVGGTELQVSQHFIDRMNKTRGGYKPPKPSDVRGPVSEFPYESRFDPNWTPLNAAPRAAELFFFERDMLEVQTTLTPEPNPRWRYHRVLSALGSALRYSQKIGDPIGETLNQHVWDELLPFWESQPIMIDGSLQWRVLYLGSHLHHYGTVSTFDDLKSIWQDEALDDDIQIAARREWVSFRSTLIRKGDILEENYPMDFDWDPQ